MGRKNWDSLPERFRPLPGRRNIVITRNAAWAAAGAEPVPSLPSALALLHGVARAYVIGGAEIYALALPLADELVLTEIDAELDGDVFFPHWDRTHFSRTASEPHTGAGGVGYRFTTYRRTAGD
jgi:dihydrofolate reductase